MTPADLSRLLALLNPTYPNDPPPPALGMKVWMSDGDVVWSVEFHYTIDYSERYERGGWAAVVRGSVFCIDVITDFRTNEILWRRT